MTGRGERVHVSSETSSHPLLGCTPTVSEQPYLYAGPTWRSKRQSVLTILLWTWVDSTSAGNDSYPSSFQLQTGTASPGTLSPFPSFCHKLKTRKECIFYHPIADNTIEKACCHHSSLCQPFFVHCATHEPSDNQINRHRFTHLSLFSVLVNLAP